MTDTTADSEGDQGGQVVGREVATTLVETGAGYIARVGDMVLWAEPPPGRAGADGLDTAVLGLRDIAAQLLPEGQAAAQISTLCTDVRVGKLAGLAALVPTSSGILSVALGWGVVAYVGAPPHGSPDGGSETRGGTTVAGGAVVEQVHLNHDLLAVGRSDVTDRLSLSEMPRQPAAAGLVQGVVPGGAALVATRFMLADAGRKATSESAGSDRAIDVDAAEATPRPTDGTADTVTSTPTDNGKDPDPAHPTSPTAATGPAQKGSGSNGSTPDGPGSSGAAAEAADDEVADVEIISVRGTQAPALAPIDPLPPGGTRGPRGPEAENVLIEGVSCIRGHLNDPLALTCTTCAVSMIQRRGDRIRAPRPPLGLLILDDGATYSVGAPLILGSAPDRADAVSEQRAWGVPLSDSADGIEALHAELRPDGWQVLLIDWSNRGTYQLPTDGSAWEVAPRGTPTPLTSGTRIGLGGRIATFTTGPHLRPN